MSSTYKRSLLIGLVCAVAGSSLSAHETWLAATERLVGEDSTASFDMSSGEQFPILQTAIDPSRIEVASCRQGAVQSPLQAAKKAGTSLRLHVRLASRAGATCWVQLKPRSLDLSAAKVEEYLNEIDAPEAVRKAWVSMPEPKRWSETYTKNAKVVLPGIAGQPVGVVTTPVGLKLEFVSESDLSMGILNGPLRLTVLLDGKPLSGLAVALWGETKGQPMWQTSDAGGHVSFVIPSPGRWMISGTDLRAVNVSAGTWESQFSTLVFEIVRP